MIYGRIFEKAIKQKDMENMWPFAKYYGVGTLQAKI